MPFNARQEDYQRLVLRFAHTLRGSQGSNMQAFALFDRRFAFERDTLPQTDEDRAFHLVAQATRLIDYELPFASDEAAETIISHATHALEEALTLDRHCFDALRMLEMIRTPSFEPQYRFLLEHKEQVRRHCEEGRLQALRETSTERAELASTLALSPYLRWMAMLAEKALVCGHNRAALEHVCEALEQDPTDRADLCLTAAYASAKLEEERGIELLSSHLRRTGRRSIGVAWLRLARASLSHRQRDFASARTQLRRLVIEYPRATVCLARQNELPEGVFARFPVSPQSEDELVVAISEGTVLFQEGRDALGMGVFGAWVMHEAMTMMSDAEAHAALDLAEPPEGATSHERP